MSLPSVFNKSSVNVFIHDVQFIHTSDEERRQLVPVITTLLKLSPKEKEYIMEITKGESIVCIHANYMYNICIIVMSVIYNNITIIIDVIAIECVEHVISKMLACD